MSDIVLIAGSADTTAKSSRALEMVQSQLRRRGVRASVLQLRNLPAEDLLHGRATSAACESACCRLAHARGIVLATPICKASYTGLLKAFLDLLPPNALHGKAVLPIAVGGCRPLAFDTLFPPVLRALGADHILPGVFIADAQIQFAHGGALEWEEEAALRLRAAVNALVSEMQQVY